MTINGGGNFFYNSPVNPALMSWLRQDLTADSGSTPASSVDSDPSDDGWDGADLQGLMASSGTGDPAPGEVAAAGTSNPLWRVLPQDMSGIDPLQPSGNDWDQVKQDGSWTYQQYKDGINGIGDCYFVAALVGVAKSNPQTIRNLIHQNANGSYTVSFHGRAPVTVNGKGVSNGLSGPLWAKVIEEGWEKSQGNLHANGTASDGGSMHDGDGGALYALTGKHMTGEGTRTGGLFGTHLFSSKKTSLSPATMQALRNHVPAIALANSGGLLGDSLFASRYNSQGVVQGHYYSVIGIDKAGNIELRNPWGDTPATAPEPDGHKADPSDGTFWMTQKEFCQNFTDIDYAS